MPWRDTLISPQATIRDAIANIDSSSLQICMVVDAELHLIGTVTDGDIRRGILAGHSIEGSVLNIVNRSPQTMQPGVSDSEILTLMKRAMVRQIPLIDGQGQVVGLSHIDVLTKDAGPRSNIVLLMAGGLGTRLRPLTEKIPKPLLPIGGKPLLEIILDGFIRYRFRRFYISVNYKGEMIKDYFGNGSKWGVDIQYVEESEALGTAGALSMLPVVPTDPMIVMNGDLLTHTNYDHLIEYHSQHKALGTMCVREYDFQVPFGVVNIVGNLIKGIDEKPVHSFFVNAGIYVLDASLISRISVGQHYNMTTLFEEAIERNEDMAVFPIREYWRDVGRADDLTQANKDIQNSLSGLSDPVSK